MNKILISILLLILVIMGCNIFQTTTSFDNGAADDKSICGPSSDLQKVNQYNGLLGIPVEFVEEHKGAVGAMTNSVGGKFCSGTLIGPSHYFTAGHCIKSNTVGSYIAFNYELSENGQPLEEDLYEIVHIVEYQYAAVDYAILELKGEPGNKYGWRTMRSDIPELNETLIIIQHPRGRDKEVEVGNYVGINSANNRMQYADLDTEPGSSGSGILDANGNLVGVHTNGGCSVDENSANHGYSIELLRGLSENVQKIVNGEAIPTLGAHGHVWNGYFDYKSGDRVVWNGYHWEAKWVTKGDEPGTDQWGPWKKLGPTGEATPVPTATSTNTPIPTATTPPNATPTPVVTNTPGSTATPVPATPTATTGSGYPAWALNATYTAGDIVSYNGSNYKALVTHTAYADSWNPADAPTLWKAL